MVRVAILGASGYTALELIKVLLNHPQTQITCLTSRQEDSPHISQLHPSLANRLDLRCEDPSPQEIAQKADFVFCALPHVASMSVVPGLLQAGCRVVDLSADYRLRDPAVYKKWYAHEHTDPERLKTAVYGLPELFADRIPAANLIANPGCYTSTSILALAPLLAKGIIDPTRIVIDAKSGVSGAGRTPKLNTLYAECNESFSAYGIGTHRHQPEIEQVLTDVCGETVEVTFTPHLVPMDRGILATIYPQLKKPYSVPEILGFYREFYQGKPFVRVCEHLPATKDSAFTNYFDVTVRMNRQQLVVVACLDNLIKGAAGVAIQNYNLMNGFPETMGFSN